MPVSPEDIPLPEFVSPILEYIQSNVPAPVYSLFLSLLSHSLAVITAFISLIASLLSTNPLEWDAQTILPPLIALLSAYLALLSLYRTATFFVRTGIWFVKWGTLFGLFIAAFSWIIGSASRNTEVGRFSVVSGITGILMDLINGQGQNAAGTPRTRQAKPRTKRNARPRPWDSFDKHKEWQYQERRAAENGGAADQMLEGIMASVEHVLTGAAGSWWEVAKGAVQGDGGRTKDEKSGGSRSR